MTTVLQVNFVPNPFSSTVVYLGKFIIMEKECRKIKLMNNGRLLSNYATPLPRTYFVHNEYVGIKMTMTGQNQTY